MLKKIIPIALSLSMLIPTIASADASTKEGNSAKAPYATELLAERTIIKTNYDTNQAIRDSRKEKIIKIKALIAQNKANKTLQAKKADLIAQRAVVKADRDSLKAINAKLKPIAAKAKTDKAAKDFASLLTDLKAIPDLQTSKTPVLQKLNSDLDQLITLLSK
ncbi:MAG: hypothetical protein H7Y18_00370 [Clostridiaceae bacterium]|nr:hypothetical protein [Clostridiaceae bacterium]